MTRIGNAIERIVMFSNAWASFTWGFRHTTRHVDLEWFGWHHMEWSVSRHVLNIGPLRVSWGRTGIETW